MGEIESLLLFMVVAFCFAFIILLKRESLPQPLKRPLAFAALFMVASSFVMFVAALFLFLK